MRGTLPGFAIPGDEELPSLIAAAGEIVILTPANVARSQTGDKLQAFKTAKALQELGASVKHVIYAAPMGKQDSLYASVGSACLNADIVHFLAMPLFSTAELQQQLRAAGKRPRFAGSTIFWDSAAHRETILRNTFGIRQKIRVLIRLRAAGHIRRRCEGLDLLLPNSQAEIRVLRQVLGSSAPQTMVAVPNGVDPVPDSAYGVARPQCLPQEDYVLYPGAFHARKNQLGFIRAMRETGLHVVFMGGAMGAASESYLRRCRAESPAGWCFLGHVEHGSETFYGVFRHARVVCLASSCETPGIAALEAAQLGSHPVVTSEGCAREYLGDQAVYCDPLSASSIRQSVLTVWDKPVADSMAPVIQLPTWRDVGKATLAAYVADHPTSIGKSTERPLA